MHHAQLPNLANEDDLSDATSVPPRAIAGVCDWIRPGLPGVWPFHQNKADNPRTMAATSRQLVTRKRRVLRMKGRVGGTGRDVDATRRHRAGSGTPTRHSAWHSTQDRPSTGRCPA